MKGRVGVGQSGAEKAGQFTADSPILSGGVVLPLKWTEVGEAIGTALGNGSNVVNLPSILTVPIAVETPTNPSTTLVFAPYRRGVAADYLRLVPDSKLSFITKICHIKIGFC